MTNAAKQSRVAEAMRDAAPTISDPPPEPTQPKPTKKVSPAVTAARAFNRLVAIEQQCIAEIAASPESIRARYAEKAAKVKAELDADARGLLDGMLSALAPKEGKP